MTITIYRFDNKHIPVEIPCEDITDIKQIDVKIRSGDETARIYLKDGTIIDCDSATDRFINYNDGSYTLRNPKEIERWMSYRPSQGKGGTVSYERYEEYINNLGRC